MLSADITFSYRGGSSLFSHLNFSVPTGKKLRIISDPGSGKTTLAKILTGPVPAYSGGNLEGSVVVDGVDILSMPAYERLKLVGRVSQNSDEMMLFSSIEEEISFPLANIGLEEEEISLRTRNAISLFGLDSLIGVPASELSGGEKRRLMLSILFAVDPSVYILDESFDELSPAWRKKLVDLINASDRTFIILGSHELEEYAEIQGDILTIKDGQLSCYEKKPLPVFDYDLRIHGKKLTVSSLVVSRFHKSISDSASFNLSVPDFGISQGDCVVLTGDNGAGKSSFSRVLCGLLEEKSGNVKLDGKLISGKDRRKQVAYLMQNPYEELFLPTVLDEAKSTGARGEDIKKAMKLFHLNEDWYTAEISYGRAKLLQAMVFYLLKRPFAIFDEFDSSLSYEDSLEAVRAYLDAGSGLIVITHDMAFASLLPGRRMRIENGVLV